MAITKATASSVAPAAAGDLVYGSGTNDAAVLALGTAGQVLTVNGGATAPEWATPAGGGSNWSLLNSGGTSLTGTLVTVSGITNADKIMILVSGARTSSVLASGVQIRLNADSGSNYNSFGSLIRNTGTLGTMLESPVINETIIRLGNHSTNASSVVNAGITFTGCNSSGVKQFIGTAGASPLGGSSNANFAVQGFYNSSSVISSISIRMAGDTMTAGTVFVYTSA
jgi:hypothetical protein